VPELVNYRHVVIILTRRCLIGTDPWYLGQLPIVFRSPVMAQRRRLRSSAGHQLVVPAELMWPSGVLCTWSENVELFA